MEPLNTGFSTKAPFLFTVVLSVTHGMAEWAMYGAVGVTFCSETPVFSSRQLFTTTVNLFNPQLLQRLPPLSGWLGHHSCVIFGLYS